LDGRIQFHMSEDSSAEAPATKKSPRKRSTAPRKKALKRVSNTEGGSESTPSASDAPQPQTAAAPPEIRPPKQQQSNESGEQRSSADRPASQESGNSNNEASPKPRPEKSREGGGGNDDHPRGGDGRNRSRGRRGGRQQRGPSENRQQQPPQQLPSARPDVPLDLEELKAKAWKIYATEICEEGLRFVDESDAAKLVRRSFKMAEIFMKFEQQQVRAPEPTRNNTSATPQQAQPERQQQSSRREETSGNPEAAASEDQEPQDSAEAPSVGDAKESEVETTQAASPEDAAATSRDDVADEEIEPPTISVD
jgi:hypothetical protein